MNIQAKTTKGKILALKNDPNFKIFTDLIYKEILDPLKNDLISKKYDSLTDQNSDQKTYQRLSEIIAYPENYLFKQTLSPLENIDVYD